uniref:TRAF-type domain-containing protein n=1 Tax=Strigamia maritima TaxID=126957 RepID=T1IZU1_STRMM
MNSEFFICWQCGLKNCFKKEPFWGHIFCQRCGAKTDLNQQPPNQEAKLGKDSNDGYLKLVTKLCSYCDKVVDGNKVQSHCAFCDMYPITCNFCNGKFIRYTMSTHIQECVHNLQWCKFSPIGCKFQGTPKEVEKHEGGNFHSELMMKLLLNIQTEQSSISAKLLARLFNERMPLNEVGSSSQGECCIKIKVIQDELKETKEMLEVEVSKYKQQISEMMLQSDKLKHKYGNLVAISY